MIPGVTDQTEIPRIGKIRLGYRREPKPGKKVGAPVAAPHFVLTDAPEVAKLYGDKPTELPIRLPSDVEEAFFPTRRAAHRKSGLFCSCDDGKTAFRSHVGWKLDERGNRVQHDGQPIPLDPEGLAHVHRIANEQGRPVPVGTYFEMPCTGEECSFWRRGFCRRNARLYVVLPEVPKFGCYEISTTSVWSIRNVLNMARAIKAMSCRRAGCSHDSAGCEGSIAWMPLLLKLQPKVVHPPESPGGKTVFVLALETTVGLLELASQGRLLQQRGAQALLPAATDDVPDELVPEGGEALDRELTGQPDLADELFAVGTQLGMSDAQIELAIRNAGDNVEDLLGSWETFLKERQADEAGVEVDPFEGGDGDAGTRRTEPADSPAPSASESPAPPAPGGLLDV